MNKHFPVILLLIVNTVSAQVKVQSPLVENLTDPVGIDIVQPHFSWQLAGTKRNI